MALAKAGRRSRRALSGGFSLIEVLIAGVIMIVVMLGILPIFMQSVVSNETGSAANRVNALARQSVEDLYQLPLDNARLEVVTGNEREAVEYYDPHTATWQLTNDDETAMWMRTTTIRQYGVGALDDLEVDSSEALPAGSDLESVHFKEILIRVDSLAGGAAFGPARSVTLRTVKSF